MNRTHLAAAMTVCMIGAVGTAFAQRPAASMSFFVTSANPKGGNLGGLAGGDSLCQSLAQAAGAGGKTWHAYLSSSTVDAKTRIGNGPWYNFKGERIASNVADLHSANNKITASTALTEKGTTRTTSRATRLNPSRSRCSTTSSPARTRTARRTRTPAATGQSATPTRRPCSATPIAWAATPA